MDIFLFYFDMSRKSAIFAYLLSLACESRYVILDGAARDGSRLFVFNNVKLLGISKLYLDNPIFFTNFTYPK